jgi:hypothetical protein
MRVRLGEHGFQLIARSLARNLQFPGGDIGRRAARDDAGELSDGVRQNVLARIVAGGPGLGPKAFNVMSASTSCGCAGPPKGQIRTMTGNLSVRGMMTGSNARGLGRDGLAN